ncbi:MAG: helix-turn-helix domain-containing protein [Ruminococcus sp.]|nr:helix-turn-helix domain-containing protein [Ruminococcus sp.]
MNIGGNLRQLRTEKNITQAEVAEKLDVTQVFISKVESNIKRLSVEQVFELSQILDCSTDAIIIGKD